MALYLSTTLSKTLLFLGHLPPAVNHQVRHTNYLHDDSHDSAYPNGKCLLQLGRQDEALEYVESSIVGKPNAFFRLRSHVASLAKHELSWFRRSGCARVFYVDTDAFLRVGPAARGCRARNADRCSGL